MDLSLKTIVTKFLLIIKSFSTLNDSRNLQSLQLKKKKKKSYLGNLKIQTLCI